jgi:hypothetical protein
VKSGFVAVAGRPNVGKSTLVNALAGGKVAIVSDKPQTTRRRISGVVNGDGYQLVLVDLPGFQRPLDPMTDIGPMVSGTQRAKAWAQVEAAVAAGAELLTGGGNAGFGKGHFLEPCVLTGVPAGPHTWPAVRAKTVWPFVTRVPTLATCSRPGCR